MPGRRTCWFEAAGWPDVAAGVHLVDVRRRALLGWILAGLLAIAWPRMGRRAGGRGLLLPALVFAGCALLGRWFPSRYDAITAGGLVGSATILVVELSRRWRRMPRAVAPPVRSGSSLIGGVPRGLAGAGRGCCWPWGSDRSARPRPGANRRSWPCSPTRGSMTRRGLRIGSSSGSRTTTAWSGPRPSSMTTLQTPRRSSRRPRATG